MSCSRTLICDTAVVAAATTYVAIYFLDLNSKNTTIHLNRNK